MTFAEKVLSFNAHLNYAGPLPSGIAVMNPFAGNVDVSYITRQFFTKFYNDERPRHMILGINPGRLGAGATGVPFTDTIRLNEKCGIAFDKFRTYEPSSSFVYDMIDAYGGTQDFYHEFFISAICPLGFTKINEKGNPINYNYYDSPELLKMMYRFIIDNIMKQIDLGIDTSVCYCLGTGKNESFLQQVNAGHHFFQKIVALEHPRYIMQYKAKRKDEYIRKYLNAFKSVI